MQPLPTQISGALFLSRNSPALLADAPRVGKTGAAIIAADYELAERLLIITTASGRGVWRRALPIWSAYDRPVQILTPSASTIDKASVIVGWPSVSDPKIRAALLRERWDVLIPDECHAAKNHEAKRTRALYGDFQRGGAVLDQSTAIVSRAARTWLLSGTPLPHSPADAYPMMRALTPERLRADPAKGWPDVTKYDDFLHRYCVVRMKKLSQFNKISVVMGGRNLEELHQRLEGFWLRRTQKDVGITEPIYELLPLVVSDRMKRSVEAKVAATAVLAAAEAGDTKALEMHLGPLRRLTGEIKAHAIVELVKDEMAGGLDRIVLMYWHKDVGQILLEGLSQFGVVQIDGATVGQARDAAEQSFLKPDGPRVFLGQIVAAGEALDLSSAADLIFVETSFTPKDQAQAALRVTNHQQTRQPRVRVATLEGSLDEAIQSRLMNLWAAIREVLPR